MRFRTDPNAWRSIAIAFAHTHNLDPEVVQAIIEECVRVATSTTTMRLQASEAGREEEWQNCRTTYKYILRSNQAFSNGLAEALMMANRALVAAKEALVSQTPTDLERYRVAVDELTPHMLRVSEMTSHHDAVAPEDAFDETLEAIRPKVSR